MLHPLSDTSITGFSVHPSTVAGIAGLAGLYAWRVRREGRSPSGIQASAFAVALVSMFLSLNGPLHDLSDYYLFSAHMVQHLTLTFIVPLLLVVGTPGWMLRPALRFPAVNAAARWLTRPVPSWFTRPCQAPELALGARMTVIGTGVRMCGPTCLARAPLPRAIFSE